MVSPDLNAKIKALEQQLKLYGAVFQRLDVGVHVIDLEQNTVLYNPAMGKFEGEDPAKVMGRPLLEALSFLQEKDSTLLRVLRSRQALPDLKQSYGNSQGQAVVTINSNQPLFIDGQMVGALEIAKDVTYVQRLSEKILDLHEHISQRKKNPERAPGEQVITAEVRYRFEQILGRSATMARVLKQAQRMAQTSSNVLIYGETGTGKELFVQSIHAASARSAQPFIDVNCAALPSQLLEGLLFGSVKGSFTDAQDRAGLFEQAHRGTLLLDEVNSMHPELQGKLLRVLQEKSLRRLGASKNTEIDVRVIATMNVAPDTAIARKELREDLYYRLSVASLHIPPLRERPEDIALYAEYFLQRYSQSLGRAVKACSPRVSDLFLHHPWPGNVRQLEHVIEGALNLMLPEEMILQQDHLPMLFKSDYVPDTNLSDDAGERLLASEEAPSGNLKSRRVLMESQLIKQALEECHGNVSRAARQIGITRQLLQYKIKRYLPKDAEVMRASPNSLP